MFELERMRARHLETKRRSATRLKAQQAYQRSQEELQELVFNAVDTCIQRSPLFQQPENERLESMLMALPSPIPGSPIALFRQRAKGGRTHK